MLKVPWTSEKEQVLIAAWKDPELSIVAFAKKIGLTKSAVLGKAHRLKLPTRASIKAGAPKKLREPPTKKTTPPNPQLVPSRRTCAWPIGHPDNADFHYCGADVQLGGSPYCTEHHRRAYVPRKEKP